MVARDGFVVRQFLERNARAEIRAKARGDKPTYNADPKSMNTSAIRHQPRWINDEKRFMRT
jgi:hypothetical protein